MAQMLSSSRRWRRELSVPPAQSATPATPSPAPRASWPIAGIAKAKPQRTGAEAVAPGHSSAKKNFIKYKRPGARIHALVAWGGGTWGSRGGPLGRRVAELTSPAAARAQRLLHGCAAAQKGPLGQRAHVPQGTIKSGGVGCLSAQAPGLSEAFAALKASERLLKGLVHQRSKAKAWELGACPLRHQAFQKPSPCWRLLKGLVHQLTDTQLPRDRKRKRPCSRHLHSHALTAPAPLTSGDSAEQLGLVPAAGTSSGSCPITPQEQEEVEKPSGAIGASSCSHLLLWHRTRIFSNLQRLVPMTATSTLPWSGAPAHLLHHPAVADVHVIIEALERTPCFRFVSSVPRPGLKRGSDESMFSRGCCWIRTQPRQCLWPFSWRDSEVIQGGLVRARPPL
ncbi:hypothetical protein QTO34_005538 [Cnephaeus nilssonii]|uniref:Uncharacterized protein n=1 Tax=Cnephaeus nilssonii TaxID=3371016 RepID=A0AA40LJG9_CNENI|nr:hypothetical protein QTO34_005538 [Eptesicus nilssonii]